MHRPLPSGQTYFIFHPNLLLKAEFYSDNSGFREQEKTCLTWTGKKVEINNKCRYFGGKMVENISKQNS